MRVNEIKKELKVLAKLKADKKELEKEIKEYEEKLLGHSNCPENFKTTYGTLRMEERRNFSVPDNFQLIEKSVLTKSVFIQNAKISPSKIKQIIGENTFDELLNEGVILEGKKSQYFKLV